MIKNRIFALIFRGASLLIAFAGVSIHLGIFEGQFNAGLLMYYTVQSNLLAIFLFGMLLAATIRDLRKDGRQGSCSYFPRFEMIVVIDILLTLLVFWVMLVPNVFSMGGDYPLWSFDNLSVHLITPLLCMLDYLLFAASKHLKYRDVYAIPIYPLCYVVFVSIAGFAGYVYRLYLDGTEQNFPYFFLNWKELGTEVFVYIVGLVLIFLIISHGLYLLDRKWEKPALSLPKQKREPQ